ncbi:MAG TPA: hypothetical protein VMU95_35180 [Trebonia sp.]|nr:hypothetical protein [Trebonia sp.]
MKNSRLLTIIGAVTVIAGSSAAVIGPRAALAGTTTACGSAGVAGMSSCTYSTVGSGTFTVPSGVRQATFTVQGAQGGSSQAGVAGGRGGKVTAVLPVSPGQVLQVSVGGQGQAKSASNGGSSEVSTESAGLPKRLLLAGGGGGAGGTAGTNYIAPSASSVSSSTGVRCGNGMVTVSWQEPTTLMASPAMAAVSGQTLSLSGLSATLTGPNGPITGQPVTFTAGSQHLCSATTNAAGTATCSAKVNCGPGSLLEVIESLGYTATYVGDQAYQGASSAGGLSGGDCGCGGHDAVLRERALADVSRTTRAASGEDQGGSVL